MQTPPEVAIRLQRARFNQALIEADLTAIGLVLANNAVLVAGTDSALISGRKAQLNAWRREFAADNPTNYVRTPETIVVSPVAPVAFEQGAWQGTTSDGKVLARGIYTAKWRQIDSQWMIEAELYLTLE